MSDIFDKLAKINENFNKINELHGIDKHEQFNSELEKNIVTYEGQPPDWVNSIKSIDDNVSFSANQFKELISENKRLTKEIQELNLKLDNDKEKFNAKSKKQKIISAIVSAICFILGVLVTAVIENVIGLLF